MCLILIMIKIKYLIGSEIPFLPLSPLLITHFIFLFFHSFHVLRSTVKKPVSGAKSCPANPETSAVVAVTTATMMKPPLSPPTVPLLNLRPPLPLPPPNPKRKVYLVSPTTKSPTILPSFGLPPNPHLLLRESRNPLRHLLRTSLLLEKTELPLNLLHSPPMYNLKLGLTPRKLSLSSRRTLEP